jgi:hypothetical protein
MKRNFPFSSIIFLYLALCRVSAGPWEHWTPRDPAVSNAVLTGITYGNGKFVAVGDQGTLITSSDGATWNNHVSGAAVHLTDVVYGGGQFVVSGEGGTLITSTNGVDWLSQNSGTSNAIAAVAFGNGAYIAVGPAGLVLTSANGRDWERRDSGISDDLLSVTYGNNVFIAGGSRLDRISGFIMGSTNGINWGSEIVLGRTVSAICFANGTFLAGGMLSGSSFRNLILVSANGTSWDDRSQVPPPAYLASPITAVGGGSGGFVAAFSPPLPPSEGIFYSADNGASWSLHYWSQPCSVNGVAFGNHTFVAVGAVSGDTGNLRSVVLQSERFDVPELSGLKSPDSAGFQINLSGEIGQILRVQATTAFPATNWIDLATVTNDQPIVTFTDSSANGSTSRFYRVVTP